MKVLRNTLASLALVLAIGVASALALDVTYQSKRAVLTDQSNIYIGECIITSGTIYCDATSSNLCDELESTTWFRYFQDNACQTLTGGTKSR